MLASLRFRKGEIDLAASSTEQNVTSSYEDFDTDDARQVLEEVLSIPSHEAQLGPTVQREPTQPMLRIALNGSHATSRQGQRGTVAGHLACG